MEDIFNNVTRSKEQLKTQVYKLRAEGRSWRECESILKTPQSTLRWMCKGVQETPPSVQETPPSVQDCADSVPHDNNKVLPSASQSNKDYITREEIKIILEEFKGIVENAITERANRAIKYYIENTLNSLVKSIVKEKMGGIERA